MCTRCDVATEPVKLKFKMMVDDGRLMSGPEIATTSCPRCGQIYWWDPRVTPAITPTDDSSG